MGEGDLATGGKAAAAPGTWLVFEDEAGFSVTPPIRRTCSRRGRTPIARVRGRSRRRTPIAAPACYRSGQRSRLIYRPRHHPLWKRGGKRRSFAWTDYRDLLVAAHKQLDGPIVLVRDNLNVHKDARLRSFADAHDWLTISYLPSYAPDLNPVEGIWSVLRETTQANRDFDDAGDFNQALRRGLRQIQYRDETIDGCFTATGLPRTTSPLQPQ